MNIQCFYKNQRAYYLGVDMSKRMYKVRTEDGKMHYPEMLASIEFRDHSTQEEIFKTAQ